NDEGTAVAVNVVGNAYVTGLTNSANFPTASPLSTADGTTGGAFLAKFTPSGAPLVYSTRFGQAADQGFGVALDGAGNAFVTTARASSTFVTEIVVSIGGQVTLGAGGLSATTMTLSVGKSLNTSTDGGGNYSFINLPAGRNYTVTPSKASFGFEPPSRTFTNVLVNQTANFVAS